MTISSPGFFRPGANPLSVPVRLGPPRPVQVVPPPPNYLPPAVVAPSGWALQVTRGLIDALGVLVHGGPFVTQPGLTTLSNTIATNFSNGRRPGITLGQLLAIRQFALPGESGTRWPTPNGVVDSFTKNLSYLVTTAPAAWTQSMVSQLGAIKSAIAARAAAGKFPAVSDQDLRNIYSLMTTGKIPGMPSL